MFVPKVRRQKQKSPMKESVTIDIYEVTFTLRQIKLSSVSSPWLALRPMLAADGQITPQLKSIEIYVKGLKVRTRTTQPLEPFEHVLIKPNES